MSQEIKTNRFNAALEARDIQGCRQNVCTKALSGLNPELIEFVWPRVVEGQGVVQTTALTRALLEQNDTRITRFVLSNLPSNVVPLAIARAVSVNMCDDHGIHAALDLRPDLLFLLPSNSLVDLEEDTCARCLDVGLGDKINLNSQYSFSLLCRFDPEHLENHTKYPLRNVQDVLIVSLCGQMPSRRKVENLFLNVSRFVHRDVPHDYLEQCEPAIDRILAYFRKYGIELARPTITFENPI